MAGEVDEQFSGLDSEDSALASDNELHSVLPTATASSTGGAAISSARHVEPSERNSLTASEALFAGERRRARRRERRAERRTAPEFQYVGDDPFAVQETQDETEEQANASQSSADSSASVDYKLIFDGEVLHRYNSLEILARNPLPSSPVRFSAYLYYVVEACERVSREGRGQTPQTVMHLRVLLARLDTHALLYRPRIAGADPKLLRDACRLRDLIAIDDAHGRKNVLDRPHQETLFATRCAVISALGMLMAQANATDMRLVFRHAPAADHYECDASFGVDECQLARWMRDNKACDEAVLSPVTVVRQDESGLTRKMHVLVHSLQECSVEHIWRSILSLMRAWPCLPLSAELVRYVDELRMRVAFFLSYRERHGTGAADVAVASQSVQSAAALLDQRTANYWRKPRRKDTASASTALDADDVESSDLSSSFSSSDLSDSSDSDAANNRHLKRAKRQLLGLNADLFGLRDIRGGNNAELRPDVRPQDVGTLVDSVDFMQFSGSYKHVNMDFLDECERVLHEMQRLLRQCAGFAHEDDLYPSQRLACVCCKESLHKDGIVTAEHIERLSNIIEDQLTNSMTSFIDERFKLVVFDDYLQPSELETFIEMYAREVHSSLNCIAKMRAADYRVLGKRYTSRSCDETWSNDLRQAPSEPAHAMLALLALDYYTRQHCDGAKIDNYVFDCSQLEAHPFLRQRERIEDFGSVERASSGLRAYADELYEVGINAGTFRYRNQMLRAHGGEADELFATYEHPIILRMLNSYVILYNSHVHHCGQFLHAFCTWLLLMCLDKHIRGYTASGAPLHGFAATIFPERVDELLRIRTDAERKRAEWSAVSQITPAALRDVAGADALAAAAAGGESERRRRKRRRKKEGRGANADDTDSDIETQF